MSGLLVHAQKAPGADRSILTVTPDSAGWHHVGFEVLRLEGDGGGAPARRDTDDREVCIVVIEGIADVHSDRGDWRGLGGRPDPWSGRPDAAYLPPGTSFAVGGAGEIALCWAPAPDGGAAARVLPGEEIAAETRGYGNQERTIHPILMADREASSLLVCEVLTPGGHWSSYPPHKHDVDDPPRETFLEETYYHRLNPAPGFGLQRVYTEGRDLDEALAFADRDCVLVPRGYHTVSAPPGYDSYYLNVMAGPTRMWAVRNDPDHKWTLAPTGP